MRCSTLFYASAPECYFESSEKKQRASPHSSSSTWSQPIKTPSLRFFAFPYNSFSVSFNWSHNYAFMWISTVLILMAAARASAVPSLSTLSLPTSFSPPRSPLPPTQSGTASIPSSASSFSHGNNNSPPPSSMLLTTTSISVLTEPGPSVIPVTPYTFEPFPSPSSVPPISGVYPASSPKHPPPVESPGIVPDFAPAWARAYDKAKTKVGILSFFQGLSSSLDLSSRFVLLSCNLLCGLLNSRSNM